MSDIPVIDRFGDAMEDAIRRNPTPGGLWPRLRGHAPAFSMSWRPALVLTVLVLVVMGWREGMLDPRIWVPGGSSSSMARYTEEGLVRTYPLIVEGTLVDKGKGVTRKWGIPYDRYELRVTRVWAGDQETKTVMLAFARSRGFLRIEDEAEIDPRKTYVFFLTSEPPPADGTWEGMHSFGENQRIWRVEGDRIIPTGTYHPPFQEMSRSEFAAFIEAAPRIETVVIRRHTRHITEEDLFAEFPLVVEGKLVLRGRGIATQDDVRTPYDRYELFVTNVWAGDQVLLTIPLAFPSSRIFLEEEVHIIVEDEVRVDPDEQYVFFLRPDPPPAGEWDGLRSIPSDHHVWRVEGDRIIPLTTQYPPYRTMTRNEFKAFLGGQYP